ncbi:hypothetical protein HHI36_003067 [Cryptolaemus montrouzieri]|uniref:RNA polymerase II subunit A C-terminal domain phosphatase n=1 Tax=Cryptolaemus montrouzieri TaxID=559131 RepID=A0ABD2PCD6_9CUCU
MEVSKIEEKLSNDVRVIDKNNEMNEEKLDGEVDNDPAMDIQVDNSIEEVDTVKYDNEQESKGKLERNKNEITLESETKGEKNILNGDEITKEEKNKEEDPPKKELDSKIKENDEKKGIDTAEKEENDVQNKENDLQNKEADLIEVEDPDSYLLYLECILKQIHKAFYEKYDTLESGEVPDLKQVIPAVKSEILRGAKLCFSGLVPTHLKLEQSKAYLIARSLGAEVTQDLEENTTHLVAVRPGTAKVNSGKRKKNLKIVTPDWLWCCAERWEHVDERIFPLNSKGSKTDTLRLIAVVQNIFQSIPSIAILQQGKEHLAVVLWIQSIPLCHFLVPILPTWTKRWKIFLMMRVKAVTMRPK